MEKYAENNTGQGRQREHVAVASRAVFFLLSCLVILSGILSANPASAFSIPERLVYDLTWTGVKAGTATLEVVNDRDMIRIISTANSAPWVSVFYRVEDRVETVLAKGKSAIFMAQPQNYRLRIREGRHRRDKEVVFNQPGKKAVFIDHLDNETKEFTIHENVFDPLSVLYYVRTMKLEVGKPVFVDILDSKKLWNVEVQVLRKERISTVLGDVDTVVVKPLMKSEGIFNRKGDMLIWLTDDQKRIPVRMQTKVAVGSITAVLVSGTY
jgi:hypothetical protein